MKIANVIVHPEDSRNYRVNYPWLLDDEVITAITSMSIVSSDEDEDPIIYNLVASIATDGKSIYIRTNPTPPATPATNGVEYDVTIQVETEIGGDPTQTQTNFDCVKFIMDTGVCG